MSDQIKRMNVRHDGRLSREAFLRAGAVAGAGLAALASPLGARGAALAQYSERLARQPLNTTQPITLRFITRFNVGYGPYFKAAANAFTKLHPNVTIRIEPHDQDWETKVKVEIAGGDSPDLFFNSDDIANSLAAHGALVDLAPFFKAAGLKRSDFWPDAMNPQWLGNHLVGMPLDYGMHVVFYNKALFDRQHLRYPTNNWTWADFAQVGRHLTVDRFGKRASEAGFQPEHVAQYAEDGNLSFFWQEPVLTFGGDWANHDLTKATLNTPAAAKAFQFLADTGSKYYTSPSPRYATSLAFDVAHGNAAMSFNGTWSFSYYPQYPVTKWQQGNIDIVLFPRGTRRVVMAEASQLSIPVGTKPQNVKWAWEFIKFMTTDPGQRLAFQYGVASIPNSKALSRELLHTHRLPHHSKIILEHLPQATKTVYYTQAISDQDLENIFIHPWSPAPEMNDLYMGRKTAAQVMPSVNQKVQAILDDDQVLARKFGAKLRNV